MRKLFDSKGQPLFQNSKQLDALRNNDIRGENFSDPDIAISLGRADPWPREMTRTELTNEIVELMKEKIELLREMIELRSEFEEKLKKKSRTSHTDFAWSSPCVYYHMNQTGGVIYIGDSRKGARRAFQIHENVPMIEISTVRIFWFDSYHGATGAHIFQNEMIRKFHPKYNA